MGIGIRKEVLGRGAVLLTSGSQCASARLDAAGVACSALSGVGGGMRRRCGVIGAGSESSGHEQEKGARARWKPKQQEQTWRRVDVGAEWVCGRTEVRVCGCGRASERTNATRGQRRVTGRAWATSPSSMGVGSGSGRVGSGQERLDWAAPSGQSQVGSGQERRMLPGCSAPLCKSARTGRARANQGGTSPGASVHLPWLS